LKKIAVYPGSFDPLTLGHMNIIVRGSYVFDEVIVAVSNTISKNYLFNSAERVQIISESIKELSGNIKVDNFNGLLVDYVKKMGANVILRGIRTVSDFEYEYQMALANKTIDKTVETVFMMTEGEYSYLSSTMIKEIYSLGGEVEKMVPKSVEKYLKQKKL